VCRRPFITSPEKKRKKKRSIYSLDLFVHSPDYSENIRDFDEICRWVRHSALPSNTGLPVQVIARGYWPAVFNLLNFDHVQRKERKKMAKGGSDRF